MGEVQLVVRSEVAQAIAGIVKLVESTKQVEAGMKGIAASGSAAERQIVASFARMDSTMRRSMQEFAARQKMTAGREERFISPARVRGLDTSDLGSVQFGRFLKSQDLRFRRQGMKSNAAFATLNAEREMTALAKAAELEDFAGNYWSQKQQAADVESQIALNNFEGKIEKQRQAKAKRAQFHTKIVQGATAAAGAIVAASMFWDQAEMKLDQVIAGGVGFNDEIRPLLSLGDNLKDIGGMRERVRATSVAAGLDTAQAASAMFMLQSTAANLGPEGQKSIMGAGASLTQVAGGDLQTNLTAITKLMQTYGKEMGTADRAASKLLMTEDQAAVTMDDLATLMPDMLPASKLMGIGFDDLAGSIITATQVMGKNEKTFTGLRNFFLHLPDAMKAGMVHKGPFLDMLKELQKASPEAMIDLFGERTVSVVAALAEKSGEVAKNSRLIANTDGGLVSRKTALRLEDPITFDSEMMKSIETQQKNIAAKRFEDPTYRSLAKDLKLSELGHDMAAGPWSEIFDVTGIGKKLAVFKDLLSKDGKNADKAVAAADLIDSLRKAGDEASLLRANMLQISFGKTLRLQGRGHDPTTSNAFNNALDMLGLIPEGASGFTTDEKDLPEYIRLNQLGYKLDASTFGAYLQTQNKSGAGVAKRSIARFANTAQAQADAMAGMTPKEKREYLNRIAGTSLAQSAGFDVDFAKFFNWRDAEEVSPGTNSKILGDTPATKRRAQQRQNMHDAFAFGFDLISKLGGAEFPAAMANYKGVIPSLKHIPGSEPVAKFLANLPDKIKGFSTDALSWGFTHSKDQADALKPNYLPGGFGSIGYTGGMNSVALLDYFNGGGDESAGKATESIAPDSKPEPAVDLANTKWSETADKLGIVLDKVLTRLEKMGGTPANGEPSGLVATGTDISILSSTARK